MSISAQQKALVSNAAISKLDALASRRQVWQRDHYEHTNKVLYEMLAECLAIYYEVKGSKAEKTLIDDIEANLALRNVVVQRNTPVLTLIVKYVFNAERRRASAYSRALRVAVADNITSDNFAGWVAAQGGIEEVAATQGLRDETKQKNAALESKKAEVKELLTNRLDQPLALVPKSPLAEPADAGEYTLLIGKMGASGQTQVLSVVPGATQAMIEQAIKLIAEALIRAAEIHKKALAEEAADKAVDQAVNEAIFGLHA